MFWKRQSKVLYSECSQWTSSISLTWEFVWNAKSGILGPSPDLSNLFSNKLPRSLLCFIQSLTHCSLSLFLFFPYYCICSAQAPGSSCWKAAFGTCVCLSETVESLCFLRLFASAHDEHAQFWRLLSSWNALLLCLDIVISSFFFFFCLLFLCVLKLIFLYVLSCFSHVQIFATCSPPGSSVSRMLQARILGSSQPGDGSLISDASCSGKRVLFHLHHLASKLGSVSPSSLLTLHP